MCYLKIKEGFYSYNKVDYQVRNKLNLNLLKDKLEVPSWFDLGRYLVLQDNKKFVLYSDILKIT